MLGVTLGMPFDEARVRLVGAGFSQVDLGVNSGFVPSCSSGAARGQPVVFMDESWRQGAACVEVREGAVVALHVEYQPFAM
jgi:hypothetical protein